MNRKIAFSLAIALGIVLGLLYGWVINPVEFVDNTPDTLREDYKADYVLMVAEAFKMDGDVDLALQRLALLGDTDPLQMMFTASENAFLAGYSPDDLVTFQNLTDAIRVAAPPNEVPNP